MNGSGFGPENTILRPYTLDRRSGRRKDWMKWSNSDAVQGIGAGRLALPFVFVMLWTLGANVAEDGIGVASSVVAMGEVKTSSLRLGTITGPWIGMSQYTRPYGFLVV
jgi:hypothetical protein